MKLHDSRENYPSERAITEVRTDTNAFLNNYKIRSALRTLNQLVPMNVTPHVFASC